MNEESNNEKATPPTTATSDLMGTEARPIDPEVERRVLRKIDMFLMPAMIIGMVTGRFSHSLTHSLLSTSSPLSYIHINLTSRITTHRRLRARLLRQGKVPKPQQHPNPLGPTYSKLTTTQAILGSAALFGITTDLQLAVVDAATGKTDTSRLSWATSIFYFGQLVGSYPMTYALQRFKTRLVLGPAVLLCAVICAATAGVTTWQGLLVQRFFLGNYGPCALLPFSSSFLPCDDLPSIQRPLSIKQQNPPS